MHSGVHACDAMETEASGQRTDAIRGKPGARNWTEVPHYNAEIERLFSLWEAPAASCQGGKLVCAISTAIACHVRLIPFSCSCLSPWFHLPRMCAAGPGQCMSWTRGMLCAAVRTRKA